MLVFEWNDDKAHTNLSKHGVSFQDARSIFDDVFSGQFEDRSISYDKDRFIGIGMVNGVVLTVVYVERRETVRLISARKANRFEQGM